MHAPNDPFEDAKLSFTRGDLDRARDLTFRGLLRLPESASGLTLWGMIAAKQGAADPAQRAYRRAIPASGGGEPRAYANLARLEQGLGRRDAMEAVLRAGLEACRDPSWLLDRLSRLLIGQARWSEAAELLTRALGSDEPPASLAPDLSAVVASRVIEDGVDPTKIRSLLDHALEARDDFYWLALRARAKAASALGDPEAERADWYRRILVHLPDHRPVMPPLVECLETAGRLVGAANWSCRYAVLCPEKTEIMRLAAEKALQVQWPWRCVGRLFVLWEEAPGEPFLVEAFQQMFSKFRTDEEKAYAVAWGLDALDRDFSDPRVWDAVLRMFHNIGRDEEADPYWVAAIRKFADSPVFYHNRGLFLQNRRLQNDSRPPLQRSILLKPDYDRAYNLLAIHFAYTNEPELATEISRRGLLIKGDKVNYHMNYGAIRRGAGDLLGAIKAFEQAIKVKPDSAESRFNLAMSCMMIGELYEGFRGYEQRWNVKDFSSPRRGFRLPIWRGPVKHPRARVLSYMEQGMGDEVMFSWYLSYLLEDTERLLVDCDERLVGIFARTYPEAEFMPRRIELDGRAHERDVDFKTPIGHVPQYYVPEVKRLIRDNWDDYCRRGIRRPPRLRADPDRLELWRRRLRERFDGKPVIGVSWRSQMSTQTRDAQYVSIPEIARSLSADVGVINLQYSFLEEEHERFVELGAQSGFDFHTPREIDLKDDLEDVFAILQLCDACVTPLISLAWMAGAVGTPTWVFRTAGELRTYHMMGAPFVTWAPSIKMFFRKPRTSWDGVIEAINATVRHLAATGEAADVRDPVGVPLARTW